MALEKQWAAGEKMSHHLPAGHTFGSRPRGDGAASRGGGGRTRCDATNCWWAALLNGGEGWHNNHHAFALSARHGLRWCVRACVRWNM